MWRVIAFNNPYRDLGVACILMSDLATNRGPVIQLPQGMPVMPGQDQLVHEEFKLVGTAGPS